MTTAQGKVPEGVASYDAVIVKYGTRVRIYGIKPGTDRVFHKPLTEAWPELVEKAREGYTQIRISLMSLDGNVDGAAGQIDLVGDPTPEIKAQIERIEAHGER